MSGLNNLFYEVGNFIFEGFRSFREKNKFAERKIDRELSRGRHIFGGNKSPNPKTKLDNSIEACLNESFLEEEKISKEELNWVFSSYPGTIRMMVRNKAYPDSLIERYKSKYFFACEKLGKNPEKI